MISPFTFCAPTQVVFGRGTRSRLPDIVRGRRCGVLSSPSVACKRDVTESFEACRAANIDLSNLGHVSPNPRLSEVEAAYAAATADRIDAVIAVGGGSVIDAAKLLKASIAYGCEPSRVLRDAPSIFGGPPAQDFELVVLPTTAGTGAEVSKGAIITDDLADTPFHMKTAARGQPLVPTAAIVDPELCVSLSARRTAETGFDVVCHAIETLLSRVSTPVTEILARATLSEVPAALRGAVVDGKNLEARETLSLHSWLMGYNLAHASTCLPHRMQYPIGSATDTSHQLGLAALYPAWAARLSRSSPDLARSTFAYLAVPGTESPDPEGLVRAFLSEIGLTTTLHELGIRADQLHDLTDSVTGRVDLDPINPTRADILGIFTEAFH